ncbi:glycosyltransferase [Clostridium butyricum]|uniref:glycosyltransferase n=1 Tax=Clostridium butyricum TaxID=1492 RepID=UPI00374EC2C2
MISLCMIVKNEECTLEKCLISVEKFVDEIVIVDTGSIDKTKEIAMKYTSKVYDFEWCNDFAKARNFSIEKSTNDWVLILDADEVVEKLDINRIKEFCKVIDKVKVGRVKRINIYEDQYGTKKYIERVNRFFNKNYFKYEGIIHEQIVAKDKTNYNTENIEVTFNHIGYSKEVINRTNKIQRNRLLLENAIKKDSYDPYLHYQIGKSYFMGKNFELAKTSFENSLNLVKSFTYEYVEDLVESYGYTLLNLNLFNEALVLYEYGKYYKTYPDYLFIIGLIEMNIGNFQNAIEKFLECTKYDEGKIEGVNSFLPLYNIGVIFECLGFKEEAIKYYNRCGDYLLAKKRRQSIVK